LTSKNCIFCYERLIHPKVQETKNGKEINKTNKGTLYCTNPLCASVKAKRASQCRDSLSALAIGLVGLSTILFNDSFPQFKSTKISSRNAEDYFHKTSSFQWQEKTGSYDVALEVR
jgi:hypothetical protein